MQTSKNNFVWQTSKTHFPCGNLQAPKTHFPCGKYLKNYFLCDNSKNHFPCGNEIEKPHKTVFVRKVP